MCGPARNVWNMVRPVHGRHAVWLIVCLLVSAMVSGCNPLSIGYAMFLLDPNVPPDKFDFTKNKSDPKVVFIVSHANAQTQSDTDLVMADQEMAQRLNQVLTKFYKDAGTKVQLVLPSRVQEYQSKHNKWRLDPPENIGKYFGADYVVYMEITRMSLYMPNSQKQLYSGQAEIRVQIVDVANPEDGPVRNDSYICAQYPTHTAIPADNSVYVFRQRFIDKMCRDLACWFAKYPSEMKQMVDTDDGM